MLGVLLDVHGAFIQRLLSFLLMWFFCHYCHVARRTLRAFVQRHGDIDVHPNFRLGQAGAPSHCAV